MSFMFYIDDLDMIITDEYNLIFYNYNEFINWLNTYKNDTF